MTYEQAGLVRHYTQPLVYSRMCYCTSEIRSSNLNLQPVVITCNCKVSEHVKTNERTKLLLPSAGTKHTVQHLTGFLSFCKTHAPHLWILPAPNYKITQRRSYLNKILKKRKLSQLQKAVALFFFFSWCKNLHLELAGWTQFR